MGKPLIFSEFTEIRELLAATFQLEKGIRDLGKEIEKFGKKVEKLGQ